MQKNYFHNKKKAIVITTINKPNSYIKYYSELQGWDLIIVGDVKTQTDWYKDVNCIFLSLTDQELLFPKLYSVVPFNNYARKMFGYLYCIRNGYDIIYETDDDNINLDINKFYSEFTALANSNTPINVYKFYTDIKFNNKQLIYPRGLPIQFANADFYVQEDTTEQKDISVIQGLVNGDPDIDAKCRIVLKNTNFTFENNLDKDLILDKNCYCPFNAQNTFWTDNSMFYNLYLPVSVNFRYTDILRSYVTLNQLYRNNKHIKFTPPSANQVRNKHDLYKDLLDETEMYDTVLTVINLLKDNCNSSIQEIYHKLYIENIVTAQELTTLDIFLQEIENK